MSGGTRARSAPQARTRPAWRRLLFRFAAGARIRWAHLRPRPARRRADRSGLPDIGVSDLKEIERAFESAGDLYSALHRLVTLTAATSRLRNGELLALRWGDIDWAAGTVNVQRSLRAAEFGPPKTTRSRKVRLAPRTRRELRRHRSSLAQRGPEDLVFADPVSGGFLDPTVLRRRFRSALALAGLPAMHLYHLRWKFKPSWWSRYL